MASMGTRRSRKPCAPKVSKEERLRMERKLMDTHASLALVQSDSEHSLPIVSFSSPQAHEATTFLSQPELHTLERCFKQFEGEGEDGLTIAQFIAACDTLGEVGALGYALQDPTAAAALFCVWDVNGDGRVCWKEFLVSFVCQFRCPLQQRRRFLFYAIDRNGDGLIELAELRAHMAALLDNNQRVARHIAQQVTQEDGRQWYSRLWFAQSRVCQHARSMGERALDSAVQELRAGIPALAQRVLEALDADQNAHIDPAEWDDNCMGTELAQALNSVCDCTALVSCYLAAYGQQESTNSTEAEARLCDSSSSQSPGRTRERHFIFSSPD